MLLCREYSKPMFPSMVPVNHRCILAKDIPRTYDKLRLDSNESKIFFLYFRCTTPSHQNKNQSIISIIVLFIKVGVFKNSQNYDLRVAFPHRRK